MDNPVRVLAIVYKLKPGGLENRLMDIIRNIDRKRVLIDVFTYQLDEGTYDAEVKSLGGTVYYNEPLTVRNMFWYVRYFRDFLKEHTEYKIVHAHQDAWCSVFCKGAYLAGVPVRIAHSRTAISINKLGYMIKNVIKLPTRIYANYYFAVSRKAGLWLYGSKLSNKGKVQIWPNAIEAKKYYYDEKVREKVRNNNNWNEKFIVMHVGNFTPPKNHPFILRVFNDIHKRDITAKLILVGTGDRKKIEEYINEYELKDVVELLGTRDDVGKILQGADVFLFPSIFEGLPGAMIEAQAAGLPCVISDTISEEILLTPNVKVMSLNDDYTAWADSVLSYRGFLRTDTRQFIEEKGFDIKTLTDKLCLFYEKSLMEDHNNAAL